MMLNVGRGVQGGGKSGHSCPVPDFRGKNQSFPINYGVGYRYFVDAAVSLRKFLFPPNLHCFYNVEIFLSIEMIMVFFFFRLLIW